MIVNQAHCIATGGSFDNGLPFSLSMGCGTWGRNSFSDNLNYRHYLNITRVSQSIPERVPTRTSSSASSSRALTLAGKLAPCGSKRSGEATMTTDRGAGDIGTGSVRAAASGEARSLRDSLSHMPPRSFRCPSSSRQTAQEPRPRQLRRLLRDARGARGRADARGMRAGDTVSLVMPNGSQTALAPARRDVRRLRA